MPQHRYAAMAQEVEHFLGKEEVTGSNPVSSSIRRRKASFATPRKFAGCLRLCLRLLCASRKYGRSPRSSFLRSAVNCRVAL